MNTQHPKNIYGRRRKKYFFRIKPASFFRCLLILFCLFALFRTDPAWAGPNSSAGCALDLNYATHNYDAEISARDIDSSVEAKSGDEIWVAVVAQNVTDLDTYQVLIEFDPNRMSFIKGHEELPDNGPETLLKSNGATPLGFLVMEYPNAPRRTLVVASTLKGRSRDEAPEGSGIIAFLKFKVLDGNLDNQLTIRSVNYWDSERINSSANDNRMNAVVNNPCTMILQILVGMEPDNVHLLSDINEDQKIGLEEAIYNLRYGTGKK